MKEFSNFKCTCMQIKKKLKDEEREARLKIK